MGMTVDELYKAERLVNWVPRLSEDERDLLHRLLIEARANVLRKERGVTCSCPYCGSFLENNMWHGPRALQADAMDENRWLRDEARKNFEWAKAERAATDTLREALRWIQANSAEPHAQAIANDALAGRKLRDS